MALVLSKFKDSLFRLGPLILLIYVCISEFHTQFYYWGIFSFNLQFIVIYYWILRDPDILGYGFVFICGFINDVVLSLPLGTSALSYLVVSLVATYVKNMTVNTRITTDWFTFFIAIFFSNLTLFILLSKFSNITISILEISYNTFFTLVFFPFFWFIFTYYQSLITTNKNA